MIDYKRKAGLVMEIKTEQGFTLIEILVALAVSGFLMAAVYSAYTVNQKVKTVQDQVVDMQQNLRAGFNILERELRMAGYDPERSSGAILVEARPDAFSFSFDSNRDGCIGSACAGGPPYASEYIAFSTYVDADGVTCLGRAADSSPIAINEVPAGSGHYEAAGAQAIAINIEAMEFYYTIDDGSGAIQKTTTPDPADLGDITAVQVSILARSGTADRDFKNNTTYRPASALPDEVPPAVWTSRLNGGNNPPDDNFRRRIVANTIKLRNMGL